MKKTTVQEVQLLYCGQAYSGDKERAKHVDYEHPDKLYYPTPEDFENRLL
jgi:hypothetical protein